MSDWSPATPEEQPAPDEVLVEPEPAPEQAGTGVTGTATAAPAPGSDSTARTAPDEDGSYVERATSAVMQALGTTPSTAEVDSDLLDGLVLLALVKGDRATASDVHDVRMVIAYGNGIQAAAIRPFDALAPKEQQGLDRLVVAVQRAGRFLGRDGS